MYIINTHTHLLQIVVYLRSRYSLSHYLFLSNNHRRRYLRTKMKIHLYSLLVSFSFSLCAFVIIPLTPTHLHHGQRKSPSRCVATIITCRPIRERSHAGKAVGSSITKTQHVRIARGLFIKVYSIYLSIYRHTWMVDFGFFSGILYYKSWSF